MKAEIDLESGQPVLKLTWSGAEYAKLNNFLVRKLGMTTTDVPDAFGVQQNLKVYQTEDESKAAKLTENVKRKINQFYRRGDPYYWGAANLIDDVSKPLLETDARGATTTFNLAALRVVPETTNNDVVTAKMKFSKDKLFDFGKAYPGYLNILANASNILKLKTRSKKQVEIDIERLRLFR